MGFDMNYKIKVESNVEEIQDLFIQLGCTYFNHTVSDKNYMLIEDGKAFFYKFKKSFDKSKSKEITLPELRDLVVLKRNDIEDATHENIVTGSKVLQLGGKNYYWQDGKWNEYPCGVDIKPIEKKEMKEYLIKINGAYKLCGLLENDVTDEYIEIPEGAFSLKENFIFFNQDSSKFYSSTGEWLKSPMTHQLNILWQRESPNDKLASAEQYRQAEVLPFIDDELHKSREWDLSDYDFAESDAWIESNIEQDKEKHSHYKKDISHLDTLDIYRITELFNPHSCGAHIAKKALCSGQRGHKDLLTDIQDIIDTAERWKEMLIEDEKTE